jgi:hypothetical protein
MRTFALTVTSLFVAQDIVHDLLVRSQWFQVEPLPDDQYEITVKTENEALLKRLVGSCNGS